jgi:hypothetical protein
MLLDKSQIFKFRHRKNINTEDTEKEEIDGPL